MSTLTILMNVFTINYIIVVNELECSCNQLQVGGWNPVTGVCFISEQNVIRVSLGLDSIELFSLYRLLKEFSVFPTIICTRYTHLICSVSLCVIFVIAFKSRAVFL